MEIMVYSLEHSLGEVERLQKEGCAQGVVFVTWPGAGAGLGMGSAYQWQRALDQKTGGAFPLIVDCGDQPGRVLSGLKLGIRHLRCRCHPVALDRLQQIAHLYGAQVDGPPLRMKRES